MKTEALYSRFRKQYSHLRSVSGNELVDHQGIRYRYELTSPDLRPDNGPRIFHHGEKTQHVIVLTHGLSDSPRYMEDVGKAFFKAGVNVILPLLPGHGLRHPDEAFEDKQLDRYWRNTLDQAIELAASLGEVISLGGFSTGGALSYNRILRDMEANRQGISGGLFLFSAAIQLMQWEHFLIHISPRLLMKKLDATLQGTGPDPFKYPVLPKFGAKELSDVIRENERLSEGRKLVQPVFAAHFLSDDTADIAGVLHLLKYHSEISSAYIIGEEVRWHRVKGREVHDDEIEWVNVAHSALPLREPILLAQHTGIVRPNPQFDLMMQAALLFFSERVGLKKEVWQGGMRLLV
ncbi:MAG: hypothetical protein IPH16_10420 [Haliscomenobacter sp.]|nr:hypothetical protein [Haliscomenobacter sp.]MBK7474851.1 hypothetical protein [Haliscomenobacter sp.]MBK8877499.1 hypothetical protein [Haliscomenobacter sp.]